MFDSFTRRENIPEMSTLSFLISPHVKISETELWGLVGRDELHIEKAPSTEKDNSNGNKVNLRVKHRGKR